MRRFDTRVPGDDGRVIVDMEALTGQAPGRATGVQHASGMDTESDKPRQAPLMTPSETRRFIVGATLAGVAVALALSLVVVLLVLFCQFVWFR